MVCRFCNVPLTNKLYCSNACKLAARRLMWADTQKKWAALPLPKKAPNLEETIVPWADGAPFYRLSCPAKSHGGRRYFPKDIALPVFPFEPPKVPKPGYYRVSFYLPDGSIRDGSEIPITDPRFLSPNARGGSKKSLF